MSTPSENAQAQSTLKRRRDLHFYKDHTAFFFGKISIAAGALISFFLTLEPALLVCSVVVVAILSADALNIRQHRKLIEGQASEYDRWEKAYTIISTSFMFTMGVWCFLCMYLSDNLFVHLLCISLSMGNLLSLVCRNFTNDKVLTNQVIAVSVPLLIGVAMYGDYRSIVLCAFFIPLLTSIRDISSRLRAFFNEMETHTEEKEEYGVQLNEALESMSHGLIMFDEDMKVRIINQTARVILAIDPRINCYSKKLDEIAQLVSARKPVTNRVRILEETLSHRLRTISSDKVFQISNSQYLELSIKLRDEGGCVLVFEDVSQRIQYESRINQLARFDELTGLCNRSFFLQQSKHLLSQAKRHSKKGAVLFFDLDDFKRINDTFGHEAGDYILSSVADRLKRLLPSSAVAARYGGDEFVVYLDGEDCPQGIEYLADRIVKDVAKELMFNNQVLRYGASLGIARFPRDAGSIDRLLKLADLALYEAKEAGKNSYRNFTAEMENSLQERVELEDDLTKAVRMQQLELHFQPIIDIKNGKPGVFEALTRWTRNGENISPSTFIPIAEDLGLIQEIGNWTLIEACRQCAKWPNDVSVAVNVSAVQFHVGSIISAVEDALEQSRLAPSRLEIEITETAVLKDLANATTILEKLSSLGVKISLDDFGTGYSSLSYLHKLPLNKVKIDKTFIDDITSSGRSRTLLKGITALGRALELKIVIEGIETENQVSLLTQEYELDYMQGYYFGKAVPALETRNFFQPLTQGPKEAEAPHQTRETDEQVPLSA